MLKYPALYYYQGMKEHRITRACVRVCVCVCVEVKRKQIMNEATSKMKVPPKLRASLLHKNIEDIGNNNNFYSRASLCPVVHKNLLSCKTCWVPGNVTKVSHRVPYRMARQVKCRILKRVGVKIPNTHTHTTHTHTHTHTQHTNTHSHKNKDKGSSLVSLR